MFKLFEKDFVKGCNYSYEEEYPENIFICYEGTIIKCYIDGSYERVDSSKYLVVPTLILTKSNIAFTICEPADSAYIDVYRVDTYYVAHEYSDPYDLVGIYYLINDIQEFKKDKSNSFTFITYNNYTEEL